MDEEGWKKEGRSKEEGRKEGRKERKGEKRAPGKNIRRIESTTCLRSSVIITSLN